MTPLSLRITPRKRSYLAGEGILLDIEHAVSSPLDMETVELNRERTAVLIAPAALPEQVQILTGADYAALHRIPLLQGIGSAFHAAAGSVFSSYLELAAFRKALAAGGYRIAVRYRYGATAEETIDSNWVEISILPASTLGLRSTWFAGADPRAELASLWTAEATPQDPRLLYRVARRHDPAAVLVATDIGAARAGTGAPVLGHLNDIGAMHFLRYAVWLEPGGIGLQKIHAYGVVAPVEFVGMELAQTPSPALVLPALQRRDDSLVVLVRGLDRRGRGVLWRVFRPTDGAPQSQLIPFERAAQTTHAVVLWDNDEEGLHGRVVFATGADEAGVSRLYVLDLDGGAMHELLSTSDRLLTVLVDQGLARGQVFLLRRGPEAFTVSAFAFDTLQASSEAVLSFATLDLGAAPPDPVDVVARPEEAALSLLFRAEDAWLVIHPTRKVLVPFDVVAADAAPQLVSTPRRGVFLLFADASTGLEAVQAES